MTKSEIIAKINSEELKDLHIHTYFSDGNLSPEEVVDRWMKEGYRTIAITDHDGIEGSQLAFDYAASLDICVIPGIEFDSEDVLGRDLHILGYGIDYDSKEIRNNLQTVKKWRDERNEEIRRHISNRGYNISDEELYSINQGRYIGKPTFAQVLAKRGDFDSVEAAFNELMPRNMSIQKKALQSREVVEIIHKAGGIAVLAHPIEQKRHNETFEEYKPRLNTILDTFVKYGIDGIECYHPSASEVQSGYLRNYADRHGLIITRGSDFHGDFMNRDYSKYHK